MLTGVMIQGGKHRDKNVFMKRFRVAHSLDGDDWTVVKEDNGTKPKVGVRHRPRQRVFLASVGQKLHQPQRTTDVCCGTCASKDGRRQKDGKMSFKSGKTKQTGQKSLVGQLRRRCGCVYIRPESGNGKNHSFN